MVARFLISLRGPYGEQLIFDLDERLRSGQPDEDTIWPSGTGKTMDVRWGKFAAGPHERLSDE